MEIRSSRAQPLLDDNELAKYFILAQEGFYFEKIMGTVGQNFPELVKMGGYFEKMMGMMGQKFSELVKMGDFLEGDIKSRKIQSMAALQVASKVI